MADVTGICNSALAKIGAARITALGEASRNASLCAELYDKCRDDLLRAHSWNFATARAKLARADTAPAFGPAYAYALPADWIRCVTRSEEHTSELQSLMRNSYAVFCLTKKNKTNTTHKYNNSSA